METGTPQVFKFVRQCVARARPSSDTGWLLNNGVRVLTMQAGFGLLESSMCRKRNAANIMMKNVGDLVAAALLYQIWSYGIIYGEDVGGLGLVGDVTEESIDHAAWFFHFSFAATAATIDSGCLAERVNYFAYVLLSAWTASIVYPVTAHWVWNDDGWLAKMGFVDFAGSAVVHLLGAVSGLTCIFICGPRIGRFREYRTWQHRFWRFFFHEFRSSLYYRQPLGEEELRNFTPLVRSTNPVQMLFGTLVLWIGWYGFNGGSTLGSSGDRDMAAAKIFVTTTLGAAGGGFGSSIASIYFKRNQERLIVQVSDLCNGILAGLVGVTAGAPFFDPWIAALVGLLAGLSATLSGRLLEWLQVDDVVGAVSVHGVSGVLGVLFVGLLAKPDCAYPEDAREDTGTFAPRGLLQGGDFSFFATQCFGAFAISVWSFVGTWTMLTVLHVIPHKVFDLRSERCNEIIGMDLSEHLFDDDISFEKEHERDAMKKFENCAEVRWIIYGPDAREKFRAFHVIESERVLRALDKGKCSPKERIEEIDFKFTTRMNRLERAFDRRMHHLDVSLKTLNQNMQRMVRHVNKDFSVDGMGEVAHFPIWRRKPDSFKTEEFGDRGRDAARRIQRWWRRRKAQPEVRFRLSVLEHCHPTSHPAYNPDKEFEATAFRPFRNPLELMREMKRKQSKLKASQSFRANGQKKKGENINDSFGAASA